MAKSRDTMQQINPSHTMPSHMPSRVLPGHRALPYHHTRGLSGLTNLGNTCYMNAAMQALGCTAPLLGYLISQQSTVIDDIKKCIIGRMYEQYMANNDNDDMEIIDSQIEQETRGKLTYMLRTVFKHMWAKNCEVRPISFKRGVDAQMNFFNGMQQHDSQEFLTALLDKIHEETKSRTRMTLQYSPADQQIANQIKALDDQIEQARKDKNIERVRECLGEIDQLHGANPRAYLYIKSVTGLCDILKASQYSIINDMFSGLSLTQITCDVCEKKTQRFERFDIMTLHLPETIDATRTHYTLDELFGMYVAEDTMRDKNKYNCGYCVEKNDAKKKVSFYQLPAVLVVMIKKYQKYENQLIKSNIPIKYNHLLDMDGYVCPYSNIHGSTRYELYSVIRHNGGYQGGHYYAYCKNPINGMWYLHDDGDVYEVESHEPLDANGYVLFYRKLVSEQ